MIINDDCLNYMPSLTAESIDLVVCDPPFNIGYKYDKYQDNLEKQDYLEFSNKWIKQVRRLVKPTGTFWIIIGDKYVSELDIIAKDNGFIRRSYVVWHYNFGKYQKDNFAPCHTNLLYYVVDPKKFTFNADAIRVQSQRQKNGDKRANPLGKIPDNVWEISRICGNFKERVKHSCQLPLALTDRIVLSTSNPGDLVLDPMCGSGSVLLSAKNLNRNYIGIELSENYANIAKERLCLV